MNWYFAVEGRSHGPVSEERLAELARSGEVSTTTLIWHPGLEEWEPVWQMKPEIVEQANMKAVAQQAKGTTDRIPLPEAASAPEPAKPSAGVFRRLFGRLRGR